MAGAEKALWAQQLKYEVEKRGQAEKEKAVCEELLAEAERREASCEERLRHEVERSQKEKAVCEELLGMERTKAVEAGNDKAAQVIEQMKWLGGRNQNM
ncbi:hypothetical protein L211DRAFT_840035 [Terfezia boudieri ATCC MYA-4762]|uniref:Uncharacterized protein n=1 Tax=Terfezia boudieri ATCC MYA-4762 TaxID=1051890 RepID=A0A3N4LGX7_9PEZI|nr:hypothetical protein L211DRAFT_840035 [Terfezia boudieri ATCC MYA-4762]